MSITSNLYNRLVAALCNVAAANEIRTILNGATMRLPLTQGKNADGSALKASSPGATDFTIASTAGTSLKATGHASQNNTKTDDLLFEMTLPSTYTAGSNLTLTVNSQYAVAAGTTITATVDATAYKMTDAGAAGADICATNAQAIATTAADKSFTLTGTSLSPGDRLTIKITTSVAEGGNTGTATGQINSVRLA